MNGRTPDDTIPAVLEERLRGVLRDCDRHHARLVAAEGTASTAENAAAAASARAENAELRIADIDQRLRKVEVALGALKVQVLMWSALGSGIAAALVAVFFRLAFRMPG